MRKAYFLLILLVLFPMYALAQRTITGQVQDEQGEPLIGVAVVVRGTTTGVITDWDGRYSISVPEGAVLVFSSLGMETVERRVAAGVSVLNVTMALESGFLEEVVVTAMGVVAERSRMNFAVQSVGGEALNEGGHANIATALAGRVANLQVTTASGSPNAGSQMILRGVSSMNPSMQNEPLFVLDGMPLTGGSTALNDINPNNIENITILKGAAASALYGQQAANGVVMITTRQPVTGRIRATAGMSLEVSTPWRLPAVQTTYGPGSRGVYARNSGGGWGPPLPEDEQIFDNLRNSLQTGVFQRYNFNVTGGSERFSAVASIDHSRNHGIILNDFRNSTGAMVRAVFRPLETLQITTQLHVTETTSRGGMGISGLIGWPINDDITHWREGESNFPRRRHFNDGATNRPQSPTSPLFGRNMDHSVSNRLRNIMNVELQFTPIRNLSITGRAGFDNVNAGSFGYTVPRWDRAVVFDLTPPTRPTLAPDPPMPQEPLCPRGTPQCAADWARFDDQMRERAAVIAANQRAFENAMARYESLLEDLAERYATYRSPSNLNYLSNLDINALTVATDGSLDQFGSAFGRITQSSSRSTTFRSSLMANYTIDLPQDVQLGFMAGTDMQMRDQISQSLTGRGFLMPGTFSFENTDPERILPSDRSVTRGSLYRTVGTFGEIRADWRRIASLSVTGRWDWSSTINHNPFFYPSITGGVLFTELFDIASDTFTFGRLRGNWAQVGTDAPRAIYDRRFRTMDFPGGGFVIDPTRSTGDWGLQPEISSSWEIGTDLRFFRGRTRLDLAYYNVTSNNQIVTVRVSTASGHILQTRNEGSIRNHGMELTLDQDIIRGRDFSWTAGLNLGFNRGKVMSLPDEINEIPGSGQWGTIFTAAVLGGSTTGVLGTDYLRNEAGQVIVDGNTGFPLINPFNRLYIGNREPMFSGGLTNNFNFRGLNLSFLFDGRVGGEVVNLTKRGMISNGQHPMLEHYRGRQVVFDGVVRQDDGSFTPNTRPITLDQETITNTLWTVCSNFLEDGTFLRLNFVTLGYDLAPHLNVSQLSSLRLSFTASNVFMLTRYTGQSPMINANVAAGGTGSAGIEEFPSPLTRNFNFGIVATF